MTTKQILKDLSQDLLIQRDANHAFTMIEFKDYDSQEIYYRVYRNSNGWYIEDFTNVTKELQNKRERTSRYSRTNEVRDLRHGIETVSDLVAIDTIYDGGPN